MSERREPTVSSTLDGKEELSERRPRATQTTRRQSTQRSSAALQPVPQSGSSGFTWFVFFLTLCVAGAAGYALWQLDLAQKTMKDQRVRIVQLENKLAVSDDSATQSLASVGAKVRELNSQIVEANAEIAKLWATRNVNRDGIKAANDKVSVLDKTVSSKINKLEQAQKKIPAISRSLTKVEASLTDVSELKSRLSSVAQSATEQDILLRALRERVAIQSELLKTLGAQANRGVSASNKLKDVEKRLKETEEALTSLEAFRRTTNRDLLQLKRP